MIKVDVAGYVKRPETKTTKNGKAYNSFAVRAKSGKKADGTAAYTYLNCRDMDYSGHTKGELPADGAFVKITGSLSVSEWEKEGVKNKSIDVFVNTLEIAPPLANGNAPKADNLAWMDV